jgi:hypothetical protein
MKSSIILFISLLFFVKIDINSIRKEYQTVTQSKAKTLALYNKLTKITKKDNKTLVAYKGALTALVSKQQKGVKEKKEYFKNGVSLIEFAVKSAPNNIEIRLIRLSVQQNSPKFLKYNKSINDDKAFIFKNLKKVKAISLKKYIQNYILQSKHFSEEEKGLIKK